jgi:hypothetical protein
MGGSLSEATRRVPPIHRRPSRRGHQPDRRPCHGVSWCIARAGRARLPIVRPCSSRFQCISSACAAHWRRRSVASKPEAIGSLARRHDSSRGCIATTCMTWKWIRPTPAQRRVLSRYGPSSAVTPLQPLPIFVRCRASLSPRRWPSGDHAESGVPAFDAWRQPQQHAGAWPALAASGCVDTRFAPLVRCTRRQSLSPAALWAGSGAGKGHTPEVG